MTNIALQVDDLVIEPGSESSSVFLKNKEGKILGSLYYTDLEKRNSEEILKKSYGGKKRRLTIRIFDGECISEMK